MQINRDQARGLRPEYVGRLMAEPLGWAQQWLAEFRAEPEDQFTVALFANH